MDAEKTLTLGTMKVRYREEGSGPLLVVLHGWGAGIDLYDGIIRQAAAGYHVIGPDLPGCGGTDEPDEPMDLDDYISFVRRFLDAACPGADHVTFLGHSHGGRILIRMAASLAGTAEESLIDRLILVDSAGIVPEKTPAQKKKAARYKRYKTLLTKTGIAKLFPGALQALQKKFGSADYAAASPVMRKCMVNVVNTDLTAEMPRIKIPVLLIWGTEDRDTPLSDGRKMEQLMPEAGLAEIPGAGHFSFLENPYLFSRILASFLGLDG